MGYGQCAVGGYGWLAMGCHGDGIISDKIVNWLGKLTTRQLKLLRSSAHSFDWLIYAQSYHINQRMKRMLMPH